MSLSVVRGLSFLIIWMCVELVLRGVCVVVCVWRYPVGPEGCVPVLVMKGVCVPASGLRGGCDHAVRVRVASQVSVWGFCGKRVAVSSLTAVCPEASEERVCPC